jgi:hypothetical protein
MLDTAPARPGPLRNEHEQEVIKTKEEEEEDNTEIQYVLWSCFAERLRTPSFSITLRMAAFHSCLTVAGCTTIPAQIKRNPATKDIKSSSDKKQTPNQTRPRGSSSLPSRSCDNLALES